MRAFSTGRQSACIARVKPRPDRAGHLRCDGVAAVDTQVCHPDGRQVRGRCVVRGARWVEIDIPETLRTVPATRMKAGTEHRVPLSAAAVALLQNLERKGELVFPGRQIDKMFTDRSRAEMSGARRQYCARIPLKVSRPVREGARKYVSARRL